MDTIALVLLGAAAVAGAALWYAAERRHGETPVSMALLSAAVPALLLGAAALFGLAADATDSTVTGIGVSLAVVAAVPGGALLATAALRLAERSGASLPPPPAGTATGTPPPPPPPPPRPSAVSDPETLRGGAAIGVLERIAVVVTLLAGWPEGLAVILAVKGFGRYPELRKPSAPERFIIGTFASVLWALAVAGAVAALQS